MATTCRTVDGDLLDTICHNYYGHLRGTVEAVLEAKEELARQPQPYAAGIRIVLPDVIESTDATVQLWS